jgi:hypothetical protein
MHGSISEWQVRHEDANRDGKERRGQNAHGVRTGRGSRNELQKPASPRDGLKLT